MSTTSVGATSNVTALIQTAVGIIAVTLTGCWRRTVVETEHLAEGCSAQPNCSPNSLPDRSGVNRSCCPFPPRPVTDSKHVRTPTVCSHSGRCRANVTLDEADYHVFFKNILHLASMHLPVYFYRHHSASCRISGANRSTSWWCFVASYLTV